MSGLSPSRAGRTAVALLVAACTGGGPADGPPEVVWGYDVCDRCGMSIDDPRLAAAVRDDGGLARFDDVGEMLAHLDGRDRLPDAVWVRTYEADTWLPAERAWFVTGSEIVTPMGTAVVAFGDRRAADRSVAAKGGRVRSWEEIFRPGAAHVPRHPTTEES